MKWDSSDSKVTCNMMLDDWSLFLAGVWNFILNKVVLGLIQSPTKWVQRFIFQSWSVKLITYLHPVARLMSSSSPPFLYICFHCMVLKHWTNFTFHPPFTIS